MKTLILNPYQGVRWENQFKANLHAHANRWGNNHSKFNPDEVVDMYRDAGYKVLAITEHLHFVYPWNEFGKDPNSLGMVAIPGCELFNGLHQTLCLYEKITQTSDAACNYNIYEAYEEMSRVGATGILAHPRYPAYPDKYQLEWYVETYKKYPFLFGMEVFNPRYADAEEWWDHVLSKLMPHRPVWGFANDDLHRADDFDQNTTIILADALTNEDVRIALENGKSYFCNGRAPRSTKINSITVNEEAGFIQLEATHATKIEWITNGGQVIAEGTKLQYVSHPNIGSYVRARIVGKNNNAYTQPFGFQ